MKIFLDDVRSLPKRLREDAELTGEPWTIIRSGEECLAKIREMGLHNITDISLDNDLGSGRMMGYQVLDAIERMILEDRDTGWGTLRRLPNLEVHSYNPVAAQRMWDVIHRLQERFK